MTSTNSRRRTLTLRNGPKPNTKNNEHENTTTMPNKPLLSAGAAEILVIRVSTLNAWKVQKIKLLYVR